MTRVCASFHSVLVLSIVSLIALTFSSEDMTLIVQSVFWELDSEPHHSPIPRNSSISNKYTWKIRFRRDLVFSIPLRFYFFFLIRWSVAFYCIGRLLPLLFFTDSGLEVVWGRRGRHVGLWVLLCVVLLCRCWPVHQTWVERYPFIIVSNATMRREAATSSPWVYVYVMFFVLYRDGCVLC